MSLYYKNKEINFKNILDRYYQVIYPDNVNDSTQIVIFYHDEFQDSFLSLIHTTKLINYIDTHNYILIFGQSSENFWSTLDFDYTRGIIENEGKDRKINFIGNGSGGLFGWNISNNIEEFNYNFSNIVSFVSEKHWNDEYKNFKVSDKKRINNFCDLLFYSGNEELSQDIQRVKDNFRNIGFKASIIPNNKEYDTIEKNILNFIFDPRGKDFHNSEYKILDLKTLTDKPKIPLYFDGLEYYSDEEDMSFDLF